MKSTAPQTMDDYIAGFPKDIRVILETIRKVIQKAAPAAKEKISYGIPTFDLDGNLVHFAAFKNHIGFYPAPSGIEAFKAELSQYKGAKGSVQFPLSEPLPLELIGSIVAYRVGENLAKAKGSDFPFIGKVAARELAQAGYTRLEQLSNVSEKELLRIHGVGPKALRILGEALAEKGLAFKEA